MEPSQSQAPAGSLQSELLNMVRACRLSLLPAPSLWPRWSAACNWYHGPETLFKVWIPEKHLQMVSLVVRTKNYTSVNTGEG